MITIPIGTNSPRLDPVVDMLRPNSDETGFEQFTGVRWEPLTLNQESNIIDTTVKHSG